MSQKPPPIASVASRTATVDHGVERLEALFRESGEILSWSSPFILPGWIQAWREAFAPDARPWLISVRESARLIGIAPLRREDDTVRFLASPDVCDHIDIVCDPRREAEFCGELLEVLRRDGIHRLDADPVRPDSAVLRRLVPEARRRGFAVSVLQEDVLYALDLPESWDDYLQMLSAKQRHEIRRKLRRLGLQTAFEFRLADTPAAIAATVEEFLGLFRRNRSDKAEFMNRAMEGYFRSLAERLPEARIGVLDVDGMPAAAVMCFDHRGTRYLYNSGFDAAQSHLSVGILCKVLSIREAMARGLKGYDFLKGDETYKHQLGGRPVALYRCRIDLPG
ncbi:MAG: GNAT family N-acetyltransferase [Desulfobacteraceae bacterium]|nr:MAG: GNAT family N-acetyltransferase [Desulfobacteraceae bacterium]